MGPKRTRKTPPATAGDVKTTGPGVDSTPDKTPPASSGAVGLATEMSVNDLVADPKNRRRHGERNLGMIAEALDKVGAARSIVIDESNTVLAGNGVLQGAQKAGLRKVQIVDADGDTIIAVRRTGLTELQKRQLAMYDNRAGELAEWNVEQLREDQLEGLELKPFFFDKEIDALLRAKGDTATTPNVDAEASEFVIIVTAKSEEHQTELLERFMKEGLECRAVVS